MRQPLVELLVCHLYAVQVALAADVDVQGHDGDPVLGHQACGQVATAVCNNPDWHSLAPSCPALLGRKDHSPVFGLGARVVFARSAFQAQVSDAIVPRVLHLSRYDQYYSRIPNGGAMPTERAAQQIRLFWRHASSMVRALDPAACGAPAAPEKRPPTAPGSVPRWRRSSGLDTP